MEKSELLGFTHCPKCRQKIRSNLHGLRIEDIDYFFLNLKFNENNKLYYKVQDQKLKKQFNNYLESFNKIDKEIRLGEPFKKKLYGQYYQMLIEIKITASSMMFVNILDIRKHDLKYKNRGYYKENEYHPKLFE
jgi:hypothetical protein